MWEAKHTSAFAKPDEVLERYMPQLQHNMAVTGYQQATLSVIFGNHKYEIFEIAGDWLYQLELLEAERQFWECVQTGREPVAWPAPPPPRPIGTREVCLEGNNAWASAAVDWLEHRDGSQDPCLSLYLDQGAGRGGCHTRLRPRDRGQAQQVGRDHHPGAHRMSAPSVYAAINAVAAALAKQGIAKNHLNQADDYKYRSIDDVLDRLAPLLAEQRLCVFPRVLERTVTERRDDAQHLLLHVALRVRYTLVSARMARGIASNVFGEALDASDKATAKAMSAAFKSAMIQTFCIPIAGSEDPDRSSPRLSARTHDPEPVQGWEQWCRDIEDIIAVCESEQAITLVQERNRRLLEALSRERQDLYRQLGECFGSRREALGARATVPSPRKRRSIAIEGASRPPRAGDRTCLSCAFRVICHRRHARRHRGPALLTGPGYVGIVAACEAAVDLPIECAHVRSGTDGGLGLNRPTGGRSAYVDRTTSSSTRSARRHSRPDMN